MKINNIILVLRTHIILLSSFVIYFFCICHSGRFPIISVTIFTAQLELGNPLSCRFVQPLNESCLVDYPVFLLELGFVCLQLILQYFSQYKTTFLQK